MRGKRLGKSFGFPTANIKLDEKLEGGVFVGSVLIKNKRYKAAIFIPAKGDILEAHILDFDGNLYGKEIEVEISEKIRDVVKFDDDKNLVEQIKKDIEVCSREL